MSRAPAGLAALLLLLGSGAACSAPGPDAAAEPAGGADAVAARAARWLWSRQDADGGWKSRTYGLLRSGQALTPFVLHALLDVPEDLCARPPDGVARALAFLRRHLSPEGALGAADPDVLEYPNYATAYALLCFARAGAPEDRPRVARMRAYLLAQQYREANGYAPGALAYGGWGFGGERPRGSPGHMDLAHTRRVLQALAAAGPRDEAATGRALSFLALVQRRPDAGRPQPVPDAPVTGAAADAHDGGFYFSPVVGMANKGLAFRTRDGATRFRSYATATCDGLLALLHAGVPADDARVRAAADWLRRHPELAHPPGVPADHPTPWREAVHFYHVAVRAEAYRAAGGPEGWRGAIARLLRPRQRGDGSFVNACALMKEDDPLLATALALIACS